MSNSKRFQPRNVSCSGKPSPPSTPSLNGATTIATCSSSLLGLTKSSSTFCPGPPAPQRRSTLRTRVPRAHSGTFRIPTQKVAPLRKREPRCRPLCAGNPLSPVHSLESTRGAFKRSQVRESAVLTVQVGPRLQHGALLRINAFIWKFRHLGLPSFFCHGRAIKSSKPLLSQLVNRRRGGWGAAARTSVIHQRVFSRPQQGLATGAT